jgi:hypothetical protein
VTSDVMQILTMIAVGLLAWALGAAVTIGVATRFGKYDDDLRVAFSTFWPVIAAFWLAWRLLVRPLVPIYRGVYRVSAGKTWEDGGESDG